MDVYVVSKIWTETDSGIALGAGATMDDAQAVADRWDCKPSEWMPWVSDPGPGVRSKRWTRSSSVGHAHQEIVKVPLAGIVDWSSKTRELPPPIADGPWAGWRDMGTTDETKPSAVWHGSGNALDDLRRASGEGMAGLGYPTYKGPIIPANAPAIDPLSQFYADKVRLTDRINELMWDRTREAMRRIYELIEGERPPIRIQVGDGAAWAWLKAGLNKVTTYPSDAPMPDPRASAMMWGMPVVLDPKIPPDEIHIGEKVLIIGTGHNGLAEGEVVQVDKAALRRAVAGSNLGAGAAVTIGEDGKIYPVKRREAP
jgi:hypothetical protein